MKKLAIVYHSQSGNTEKMAQAVFQGALKEATVTTHLYRAAESGCEIFIEYDAVLFGSPENFGYLSGGLKDFFDRTFYPVEPLSNPLPYAVFISAGNDGSGAVRQLQRIVGAYPLTTIAEPLIIKGEIKASHLDTCSELGETMAAGLAMGIF